MRALALLVALAGCGRFGFGDERADGALGDGAGDIATSDASPACSPTFDLCDGFEGTSIDTTTWLIDPMTTLDSTRAHRGKSSVHVHTPAFPASTNSYISIGETKTLAGPTTFWVRGWFWLAALPAAGNGMELITAERSGSGGDFVFVFSASTHIYTQFGDASWQGPAPVPVGSWFCLVFKVVRSTTTTGALELSGDVPMLSLPNVITDSATTPIDIITLGMGFATGNTPSPQPALDLWIDDVIVDDAPLTCAD